LKDEEAAHWALPVPVVPAVLLGFSPRVVARISGCEARLGTPRSHQIQRPFSPRNVTPHIP